MEIINLWSISLSSQSSELISLIFLKFEWNHHSIWLTKFYPLVDITYLAKLLYFPGDLKWDIWLMMTTTEQ